MTGCRSQVRARLREVFDRVDTTGNGVVDIAEFRAAMDRLGKHLDGYMVAEICQALDVQNGLTFDQFCDIVDTEEVRIALCLFSKCHILFSETLNPTNPDSDIRNYLRMFSFPLY